MPFQAIPAVKVKVVHLYQTPNLIKKSVRLLPFAYFRQIKGRFVVTGVPGSPAVAVRTLTLQLQPGGRLLHLGLLLQAMRRRERGEQEELSSPRSIPPQSGFWPPDGSLAPGKEGPFCGVPTPQVFQEVAQRMRSWLDVLSPVLTQASSSPCTRSSLACSLLCHVSQYPSPPLPIPARPGPLPGFGEERD